MSDELREKVCQTVVVWFTEEAKEKRIDALADRILALVSADRGDARRECEEAEVGRRMSGLIEKLEAWANDWEKEYDPSGHHHPADRAWGQDVVRRLRSIISAEKTKKENKR